MRVIYTHIQIKQKLFSYVLISILILLSILFVYKHIGLYISKIRIFASIIYFLATLYILIEYLLLNRSDRIAHPLIFIVVAYTRFYICGAL